MYSRSAIGFRLLQKGGVAVDVEDHSTGVISCDGIRIHNVIV